MLLFKQRRGWWLTPLSLHTLAFSIPITPPLLPRSRRIHIDWQHYICCSRNPRLWSVAPSDDTWYREKYLVIRYTRKTYTAQKIEAATFIELVVVGDLFVQYMHVKLILINLLMTDSVQLWNNKSKRKIIWHVTIFVTIGLKNEPLSRVPRASKQIKLLLSDCISEIAHACMLIT